MFSDRWGLRWNERAQKMAIYSCFEGWWVLGDEGKELHTLAVRKINMEEKRLLREDGISTKCEW